jgi:hypothetical protein
MILAWTTAIDPIPLRLLKGLRRLLSPSPSNGELTWRAITPDPTKPIEVRPRVN